MSRVTEGSTPPHPGHTCTLHPEPGRALDAALTVDLKSIRSSILYTIVWATLTYVLPVPVPRLRPCTPLQVAPIGPLQDACMHPSRPSGRNSPSAL